MAFSIRKDPRIPGARPRRIIFGNFEVDLRAGEVRKNSARVRLQAQPFQLLVLLLENAGEVVTREEICGELWPGNTFVDFEHGLAAAVNKVRDALGDAADNPKYIETLPKRGYRFIGKIKAAPPPVMEAPEGEAGLGPAGVGVAKADTGRLRKLGWTVETALVMGAAVVAALLLVKSRATAPVDPVTAEPFTTYPGIETAPSISPDGSRIAFSWDRDTSKQTGRPKYDLYVKAIGSETLVRLTSHPAQWIASAWSPDGTQIAFHRLAEDDNAIYVVPAMGGPERKLLVTHAPYEVVAPLSWSPDGKWLAFADRRDGAPGDRVYLLKLDTLEVVTFPHNPACIHEGSLTFSHSGRQLAYLCVHNLAGFEYFVSDIEGKSRRSLTTRPEFARGLIWKGDDSALLVSNETGKGSTIREIEIADGSSHELPPPTGDWPTISGDGRRLAFSTSTDRSDIWAKDLLHREAPAEQRLTSTRRQNEGQFSPDGKHVAFDSDRSGVWSVWLVDTDGSNLVQITHDRPAGFPRWSPDSKKIVFEATGADSWEHLYIADIAERAPRELRTGLRTASAPSFSRDGQWIYFRGYEGTGHQIYRCPAGGGKATLVEAGIEDDMPLESVDGKVLYFAWNFASNRLMMMPLDRPGAKPQAIPEMPEILNATMFTVVGDGIYFAPLENPRAIWFYEFGSRKTREILHGNKYISDGISVSPDGRYLLYSQVDEQDADIQLVNNFH